MDRLTILLKKRKTLTANIFEEKELIDLAKKLPQNKLDKIDPELLTYSNDKRMNNITSLLDKLDSILEDDTIANKHLKPTGEIVSSTKPRQGMQFFKFDKAVLFFCQRCNREKKAKNLAVINNDWSKVLCNGCYGLTLSQLEV